MGREKGLHKKTRTKVAHKNVSQRYDKIKKSKSLKITQSLRNKQVILCDLQSRATFSEKMYVFILLISNDIFIKIG